MNFEIFTPRLGKMPTSGENEGIVGSHLVPIDRESAASSGIPFIVRHFNALVKPQPAGPVIPSNVRPPQCMAAAAIGSAYIPTCLTGSPFFYAAPSAPVCTTKNAEAPTLANLTDQLALPFDTEKQTSFKILDQNAPPSVEFGGGMAKKGFFTPRIVNPVTVGVRRSQTRGNSSVLESHLQQSPQEIRDKKIMENLAGSFGANTRLIPKASEEPMNVIAVPNSRAYFLNQVAAGIDDSLKALGCYTQKSAVAARVSSEVTATVKMKKEAEVATVNMLKDSEARRKAHQASIARMRAEEEAKMTGERMRYEQQMKLMEDENKKALSHIEVSDLLCVNGPSPIALRERKAVEIKLRQQSNEAASIPNSQISSPGCQPGPSAFWDAIQQVELEKVNLQEQLAYQEQQIQHLQKQLSDERGRSRSLASQNEILSVKSSPKSSTLACRRALRSTETLTPQDSSSRGTLDQKLDDFLSSVGRMRGTFRRVKNGVYFYGKTKVLIKIERGKLICMPMHLSSAKRSMHVERFISIDKFLKQQDIAAVHDE